MKLREEYYREQLKKAGSKELVAVEWSLQKWYRLKELAEDGDELDYIVDINQPCGYCEVYGFCHDCPVEYECYDFMKDFETHYEFEYEDYFEEGLIKLIDCVIDFLKERRADLNG